MFLAQWTEAYLTSRDEQKWSSCSWLILRDLAKKAPRLPEVGEDDHMPAIEDDYEMPSVSYAEARRIMTRTDFLDPLDAYQIIAIDVGSTSVLRLLV